MLGRSDVDLSGTELNLYKVQKLMEKGVSKSSLSK